MLAGDQYTEAAANCLDEIETLQGRLIVERNTNATATESLNHLVDMKDVIWSQQADLPYAFEALGKLVRLQNGLVKNTDQLDDGPEDAHAAHQHAAQPLRVERRSLRGA